MAEYTVQSETDATAVLVTDLDPGPVDLVLKCTKGIFEGRFLFCNLTVSGEIFGSDKDNKDLTMYIENAGLSPQHAQIQFNDQTFQYFLRDLSSETGTWLKCRCVRSVEIGIGQMFHVGQGKDVVQLVIEENAQGDPCLEWLKMYNLARLRDRLPCQTLADIREFVTSGTASVFESQEVGAEDREAWNDAVTSFERMFPLSAELGEPTSLAVLDVERNERVATVWWSGATIHLVEAAADSNDASIVYPGGVPRGDVRIIYNCGRHYIHIVSRENTDETTGDLPVVYVRLGARPHWLNPDDAFRIGALEFSVLRYNMGLSGMQGCRPTMEDAEVCIHDLGVSNFRQCSFFAVYDGHGGKECVNFVRANLHRTFARKLNERGGLDHSRRVRSDITEVLHEVFLDTDARFLETLAGPPAQYCTSGCTAVVVLSIGGTLWCANVGDCRAVLSRGGVAVDLSSDHKPQREDECKRIEAAGGFISYGRVLGRLAVSRAFGDPEYKCLMEESGGDGLVGPVVNCVPEIREDSLQDSDEFVLLACDGVFDVFTSQDAVDFVRAELARMPSHEQDPQVVANSLTHTAIHSRNSKDNVTAVILTFKRNIEVPGASSPGVEAAD
eukprot:GEMP01015036.1.p1 GENE.GEMP01015036.1~~GEMP01015036.1.p1  ORF type:complete len:613 (+),score=112.55 GEMP01015036.1:162-2000(+)